MSGFFAIHHRDGEPVEPAQLERHQAEIRYRGPDGEQIWSEDSVGLGFAHWIMARESTTERQPFAPPGANFRVVADARIDDRETLIQCLGDHGQSANRSQPDVELIAAAYQVWGEDCPQYLLGDFTFVVWDETRQQLFGARDQMGIRIMYYGIVGDTLIVSNELPCIRTHPGISDQLNEIALADCLVMGSPEWLDKTATLFADIHKLAPAHCFRWNTQGLELWHYWQFPQTVPTLNYAREEDYVAHYQHLLRSAVKDRLRLDQIHIDLSGGMDSTSIAATAVDLQQTELPHLQLRTHTVYFEYLMPEREKKYAEMVAHHLGLSHQLIPLDRQTVLQPYIPLAEPFQCWLPADVFAESAWQSAWSPYILSGNGGDELFFTNRRSLPRIIQARGLMAGLSDMLKLRQYGIKTPSGLTKISRLFRKLWSKLALTSPQETLSICQIPEWLQPDFKARCQVEERAAAFNAWQPDKLNANHPEVHRRLMFAPWSSDLQALHLADKQLVCYKPCPFLDLRLINFSLSIPAVPWHIRKYLMRRAMLGKLPEEILTRPKTPAGFFVHTVIEANNADWVDQWTDHPSSKPYIQTEKTNKFGDGTEPEEFRKNLYPAILSLWLSHR
ncbi:MAG: asparagine synthase-related protein [Cyanobacteria bacterium P01_H01_bin.15]